jgi:molecular chaperone DnaK
MMKEAEQHRAEDQALREAVDTRNELDSVAYQVERRLGELGDAAPSHERARGEMLINDARDAVRNEAPLDRVRSLTAELQLLYHGLAATQPSGDGQPGAPREDNGTTARPSDGDVIDAEFDRS